MTHDDIKGGNNDETFTTKSVQLALYHRTAYQLAAGERMGGGFDYRTMDAAISADGCQRIMDGGEQL